VAQLEQTAVSAKCSFLPGGHICGAHTESKKGGGQHGSCGGRGIAADHNRLHPALLSGCIHGGRLLADQSIMQWDQVSEVTVILVRIYCVLHLMCSGKFSVLANGALKDL
jgi:hypothetical protein